MNAVVSLPNIRSSSAHLLMQARSLKEGMAHTASLEGNMAALVSGFDVERGKLKVCAAHMASAVHLGRWEP